jgi:aspartyl-tRNA synthetase
MKTQLRTNTCGELTKDDIGKSVTLSGWLQSRRDHGGIIFVDLRDRYGLTQVVFDPKHNKDVHKIAEGVRREFVLQVTGRVRARGKGLENPKLKTGQIEIISDDLNILNKSEVPPLEIEDRVESGEDVRLKYRYLDLRRPIMQERLMLRHNVKMATHEFFNKNSFIELETPLLVRATPEGARDYVVPSRVSPGKFYALPQSPQLYKQISMVAGFDRYYQIAHCLRDEDLRADRQPEHTQIDLEMSFVEREDILTHVEDLFRFVFKKVLNVNLEEFQRLSYKESMDKYGNDKPDLRFGMELINVTDLVKKCDFQVFQKSEMVKCINPGKIFTRKEIDELTEFTGELGAKGLAWMRVTEQGLEGTPVKFFSESLQKELIEKTGAKKDSMLFFIADTEKNTNEIMGKLRNELGKRLELYKPTDFKFCWILDFPLFEWSEDNQGWSPAHHIFSSPKKECLEFLEKDPGKVEADLFDVVLNGVELGSGSIRINQPEIQERVMKVIGLSKEEANMKFGFLLNAFRYGAPPHGGMGLGLDRFVALMCGLTDIREVIAYPKNKNAECPMDGSPSDISDEQLKDLHVKVDVVKKK